MTRHARVIVVVLSHKERKLISTILYTERKRLKNLNRERNFIKKIANQKVKSLYLFYSILKNARQMINLTIDNCNN